MIDRDKAPVRLRWARLKFMVIGPLLGDPPERGDLRTQLETLAARSWSHPTTGERIRFGLSTLERWFYQAKGGGDDPIGALARKVHKHAGTQPSLSEPLRRTIELLYRQHPSWSFQLHYDNLRAVADTDPSLQPVPSYGTVSRFMRAQGLLRQKKRRRRAEEAATAEPRTPREMRSFEVEHVHGLWHLDFHDGSRKVLTQAGEYKTPQLLGILDDRSRLCCHLQWYLAETAEVLVHGLSQAIQKRGLPRALLTDNGSAMLAAETTEGLERLSIVHFTTLPYTPEQNAKQEAFWGQIEGRSCPCSRPTSRSRSSCSIRPPPLGSSSNTTAPFIPKSAARRSSACFRGPMSAARAPPAMTCAAPFAPKSRALNERPTAPSPSRACASSFLRAIAP